MAGFAPLSRPTPRLAQLSDAELAHLNAMLPWQCFTVDASGRRFGDRAWAGKREDPQALPDRRIELLQSLIGLTGRRVLEVGCFEGVHTIALSERAGQVIAVDARIENVVKTLIRCHFYGQAPDVRRCDVESAADLAALGEIDVVHHVGVLYHLVDPVAHLRQLAALTRIGMMLDTHVARPGEAQAEYESGGRRYAYRRLKESGVSDVFSGMYDHAKWLTLDALVGLLGELGFASVTVHEEREERSGLRILLFARRVRDAA
jgi:tRNA (mo5U34)-methyltransferase